MKKINDVEITAKKFAYDGCHKIYLINDKVAEKEAKENGYEIYSIDELIDCFVYSCSLRFIGIWGGMFKNIINQFESSIVFDGFPIDTDATPPLGYEMKTVNDKFIMNRLAD